jgi:hypothetical protein
MLNFYLLVAAYSPTECRFSRYGTLTMQEVYDKLFVDRTARDPTLLAYLRNFSRMSRRGPPPAVEPIDMLVSGLASSASERGDSRMFPWRSPVAPVARRPMRDSDSARWARYLSSGTCDGELALHNCDGKAALRWGDRRPKSHAAPARATALCSTAKAATVRGEGRGVSD